MIAVFIEVQVPEPDVVRFAISIYMCKMDHPVCKKAFLGSNDNHTGSAQVKGGFGCPAFIL